MTRPQTSATGSRAAAASGIILLVAAALAVLAPPARMAAAQAGGGPARSSPMTSYLCSSRRIPCSIRTGDHLREGAASPVTVSGRPRARVEVQVFMLEVVGGRILGMEPLGQPVIVALNDRGYGTDLLPVAPFGIDQYGGWALVSVSDATWHGDPGRLVGQIVPMGARSPTVLGDGYGSRKPVATTLDMEIANHISGTEFAVEYLGDDGNWHNVTIETAERHDDHQPVQVLRYSVPNGLVDKPHRFRAHNVTDPSAIDQEWVVVPATDAPPQERAPLLDPPELGGDITLSLATAADSSRGVVRAAVVLGTLGTAVALSWPALAIRRRRITVRAP